MRTNHAIPLLLCILEFSIFQGNSTILFPWNIPFQISRNLSIIFRYSVNVTIYGLETVDKHFNIEDIHFIFETFNPQFTRMELWFRFFFAIVTASVSLAFMASLRGFAMDTWSIEQKWVSKT